MKPPTAALLVLIRDQRSEIGDRGSGIEVGNPEILKSSILNHQSILNPQSSILNPQSSILNPQSSIINHQSSILNPQSSILSIPFGLCKE
jgi:hypothetical protein